MFFFLTLYMQDVLGYSPIQTGLAYLPVTAGVGMAAGIAPKLLGRIGTRPIFVAGTLVAAGGRLLALPGPRPRLLPHRPPPGHGDHVDRPRRRVRRAPPPPPTPACRPTRPGWPPPYSTPPSSSVVRWGWPSSPPSPPLAPPICSPPTLPARRPRLRLPPRAARREHLPARRRRHRTAHHQHPRRTRPRRLRTSYRSRLGRQRQYISQLTQSPREPRRVANQLRRLLEARHSAHEVRHEF